MRFRGKISVGKTYDVYYIHSELFADILPSGPLLNNNGPYYLFDDKRFISVCDDERGAGPPFRDLKPLDITNVGKLTITTKQETAFGTIYYYGEPIPNTTDEELKNTAAAKEWVDRLLDGIAARNPAFHLELVKKYR